MSHFDQVLEDAPRGSHKCPPCPGPPPGRVPRQAQVHRQAWVHRRAWVHHQAGSTAGPGPPPCHLLDAQRGRRIFYQSSTLGLVTELWRIGPTLTIEPRKSKMTCTVHWTTTITSPHSRYPIYPCHTIQTLAFCFSYLGYSFVAYISPQGVMEFLWNAWGAGCQSPLAGSLRRARPPD